jgi:hypothetical protein
MLARRMQENWGYRVGWVAMRRNLLARAADENHRRGFNVDLKLMSMFDKAPPKADLLVADEAQHDGAMSMANLHGMIPPEKILGLSATPYRTDRVKLCLPAPFSKAGYVTLGAGKLLHSGGKANRVLFDESFNPEQRWSPLNRAQVRYADEELPSKGTDNPRHLVNIPDGDPIVLPLNRMPSDRNPTGDDGESFIRRSPRCAKPRRPKGSTAVPSFPCCARQACQRAAP